MLMFQQIGESAQKTSRAGPSSEIPPGEVEWAIQS